ncbi:ran-specific GTPase-activating protein 30 [Nannizzia gypsea CBS 118893]|uniref:Ran-specific GTPase-activating protein 30 n=1 Tax=Arthroderma gypseum (strain ATCC MYA-4604 / CBS 118893) TaxID=535722 RepID=E5R0V3_ARTGP|nr:ran-specific GTPase-activating protein 30 [Nannizzia gypsea CBS 118893]EFQ98395.1 ran-specific GTPase-activating protein 30 [Nannizzia gypsea CBS 118893]
MNYAIRSGIAITATYALRQSSKLLKKVDGAEREELRTLQNRLQSKIQIISPAIDMIELIAARGNTSLESAVNLTKALRLDIQNLGQRLAHVVGNEEAHGKRASAKRRVQLDAEINAVMMEIRTLLDRIEDAVPLINLAITTSGARLSTTLPSTVSPSRLLQASTFLTAGDTQYSLTPTRSVQVGPTFTLSVYLLFASHVRPTDEEGIRETTWKEAIHKARVKICRVPMDVVLADQYGEQRNIRGEARADEFAYQILITEDLDDGRVHAFEDDEPKPGPFEGVAQAGIRDVIPIHQISKIFYADTGKILNIGTEGEANNPVLLLKRDINAVPPRGMVEREELTGYFNPEDSDEPETSEPYDDEQAQIDAQLMGSQGIHKPLDPVQYKNDIPEHWRFPPGLDLEWIALEVHQEEVESDDDDNDEVETETAPATATKEDVLADNLAKLSIPNKHESTSSQIAIPPSSVQPTSSLTVSNPLFNNIRTSLSLLETLLRLTSLQQFQQQSHLSITDELLTFFLEESSATGAGGDEHHRQRVRSEARRKVGWDPYDESPLKPRGEDYQYQNEHGSVASTPLRPRMQSIDPDEGFDEVTTQMRSKHVGRYHESPRSRRRRESSHPLSPSIPHPSTPASPSPKENDTDDNDRKLSALGRQAPSNKPHRANDSFLRTQSATRHN